MYSSTWTCHLVAAAAGEGGELRLTLQLTAAVMMILHSAEHTEAAAAAAAAAQQAAP
jgi:hypothetical protein